MEPFVTLRMLYPLKKVLAKEPQVLAELAHRFGIRFDGVDLNTTVPPRQYIDALDWLSAGGRHSLAFDIARHIDIGSFGVIDYYLQACETVGEALTEFQRYHTVVMQGIPALDIRFDDTLFCISIPEEHGDGSRMHWQRGNLLYAVLMRWMQLLTDDDLLMPALVDSEFPQLHPIEVYEPMVGRNMRFNCERPAIYYPRALWAQRLRNANARIKQLLLPEVQAEHARQLRQQTLVQQVVGAIAAVGFVRADQVQISAHLGIPESTLKRRLKEEGRTFSSLLNDARRHRAILRLCESDDRIEDLATELGFSERASFERAFRQWVGLTPGQFRRDANLPGLRLDDRLTAGDHLPPLSPAAVRQMRVATNEAVTARELAEVIDQDPLLAARILAMANSPRQGAGRVVHVEDAIARFLGTDETRRLLLALVAVRGFTTPQNRMAVQKFWMGTLLLRAVLARDQAPAGLSRAEHHLLASVVLFKDLGLLLAWRDGEPELVRWREAVSSVATHADLLAAERALWGVSRYELAHHILMRWQLPTDLANQVRALDPATGCAAPATAVHEWVLRCMPWIDLLSARLPDHDVAMDLGPLALPAETNFDSDGAIWLADTLRDCRAQAQALTA